MLNKILNKFTVILDSPDSIHKLKRDIVGKFGKPRGMGIVVNVETEASITQIRMLPYVRNVDESFRKADRDAAVVQLNPPGWGLPWMSNSGGDFRCDTDGEGVDLYVVDTGVRLSHEDFEGRASTLYSYDGLHYEVDPLDPTPFHGTSVASCAGGAKYGIAKAVTIHNCRIDFTLAEAVKALDVILVHHLNKPDNRPSVVNFSGSSIASIWGDIFRELTRYGIIVVASAGNYGEENPRFPAQENYIISVGAIDRNQERAWFSNKTCNIYGPGVGVTCANIESDTGAHDVNGTSFSAPYYTGALCCALVGSDKPNTDAIVSWVTYRARYDLMERGRCNFDNGSYSNVVWSITTKNIIGSRIAYRNPSSTMTDQDIRELVIENQHDPQRLADEVRSLNISRSRLAGALGKTPEHIDQWCIDRNVRPWWFTTAQGVA